jgi:hypothetical protein
MNSAFAHIVAFAAALLLAIPPGTCKLFAEQAEKVPAKVTCCGEKGQGEDDSGPVQPEAKCCCSKDSTAPIVPVKVEAASGLILPISTAADLLPASVTSVRANGSSVDPGPPLHVLQCVWLC